MSEHVLNISMPPPPIGFWLMDDGYTRFSCYSHPNRWRRFWYWALLGWTFEEIKS